MSIRVQVNDLCRQRRLYYLPLALGGPSTRYVYTSPEIYRRLVVGPWGSKSEAQRWGRLRADLDRFSDGSIIAVRQPGRQSKRAYLARLTPPHEEVWEIRSVVPWPSMRVFGSFTEQDRFVALQWRERSILGGWGSRPWRDIRVQCRTDWRNLFVSYQPLSGGYPNDYLTGVILV